VTQTVAMATGHTGRLVAGKFGGSDGAVQLLFGAWRLMVGVWPLGDLLPVFA